MLLLEKIRELTEPLHTFFWSDEPRFLCEDICFQYGIPEDHIGDVTWFVAPLLTKSLPLANLPQELRVKFPELVDGIIFGLAFELNQKLLQKFSEQFPEAKVLLSEWKQKKSNPMLSEQEAHKKTLEVESWYLEWKRENEKEEALVPQEKARQIVSLPLLDALSKYQRLSEQTVTEDRIAVKGESAPVRGSIRNWLRHYRDAVGIRKHSTMERGQFLFQGENTRRLSAPERERVSFLLKALDENTPVPLDVERQEVIFPVFEDRGSAATSAASSVVPALETSFRPLEKFPAQAAPIRKALEWSGSERDMSVSSVPERERPRAVGVSAPVYAPAAAVPAMEAPFAQKGSMSFSSSHVLPHEKAQEEKLQKDASPHPSEGRREPEAISVIRPRGNQFGFQEEAWQEAGASAESGSAASPVVNLRSSGGRHARGKV